MMEEDEVLASKKLFEDSSEAGPQPEADKDCLGRRLDRSKAAEGGRSNSPKVDIKRGEVTPMQYKVLENRLVHGMTFADSGYNAGMEGKYQTVANRSRKLVRAHQDANSKLVQSLMKRGVDLDKLAEKIAEGLECTTRVRRKVNRDQEELVEVPDNFSRHKFVETAVDIVGGKAPKKIEVEQKSFEQRLLEITVKDERY